MRYPRLGLLAAAAGMLAACAFLGPAPRGAVTVEHASIRGDYRLDDGREAFIGGWPAGGGLRQTTFLQLGDLRVTLTPTDTDQFRTDRGDTLVFEGRGGQAASFTLRGPSGQVTARRTTPYVEEEVEFRSGGLTLRGSLLIPAGAVGSPGVVLVHGSGPHTREVYRDIAAAFARRGIAALVYDKRGTGASDGDWMTASLDELADDALAGLSAIRLHHAVDPARVGLWGLSQGGWIVPIAAARSEAAAFIVVVSPSGHSPGRQERWRSSNMMRARGVDPRVMGVANEVGDALYQLPAKLPPELRVAPLWFFHLDAGFDPLPVWRSVRQPVLAVWGAYDGIVPSFESRDAIRSALDRGLAPYRLIIFPAADHSLFVTTRGTDDERRPQRQYAAGYIEEVAVWMRAPGISREVVGAPAPHPALQWAPRLGPVVDGAELLPLGLAAASAALLMRARRKGRASAGLGLVVSVSLVFGVWSVIDLALDSTGAFAFGLPPAMLVARAVALAAAFTLALAAVRATDVAGRALLLATLIAHLTWSVRLAVI